MSKAELASKLLALDAKLAVRVLQNEQLSARLKVSKLLEQLNLKVK
jgi:hypothetical protein